MSWNKKHRRRSLRRNYRAPRAAGKSFRGGANAPASIAFAIEPLEDRRLFAAGALDLSFSEDGKSTMEVNLGGITLDAADVAVQSDGKTVVVGKFALSPTQSDFAVARLNVDGTPDRTFGPQGNGFVRTRVGDGGRELRTDAPQGCTPCSSRCRSIA